MSSSLREIDISDMKLANPLDRLLAFIVDAFILTVLSNIIIYFLYFVWTSSPKSDDFFVIIMMVLLMFVSQVALYIVYSGYYLSQKGATPGKRLFNLKVVDANSNQFLSYSRAAYRDTIGRFCCVLSLGIGYLMILFRQDRKGLHDVLFQTLVIVGKN